MSHILKFGAAAENIGNLEFLTLGDAVAHWGNNLLDTGSGGYKQADHVVFLQVGAVVHNNATITLPFANIDSQGYDFVVTNPENHNWTRTDNAILINFNSYKCANIIFNRIHLGYSTSAFIPIGGLPTQPNSYHAADNEYAVQYYGCVGMGFSGNHVLSGIRTKVFNCIFLTTGGRNFAIGGSLPTVIENSILSVNTQQSGYGVSINTLPSGSLFQNNILLSDRVNATGTGTGDIITFSPNYANEYPKNVLSHEPASAASIPHIDPTRVNIDARQLFNKVLPSTLTNGSNWPSSTYFPAGIGGNMHALVEAMTPNNEVMKNIIPPEQRAENPLRYFINGWDSQGNEQYGACGYNWQEHFFTGLIATDLGDHTVRLDWNIPTAGVPSSYTKWGIYKVYAPRSEDLVNWLGRTRYKVGEVPRNVNTFVDTGADYSNASGADMTYRVILER